MCCFSLAISINNCGRLTAHLKTRFYGKSFFSGFVWFERKLISPNGSQKEKATSTSCKVPNTRPRLVRSIGGFAPRTIDQGSILIVRQQRVISLVSPSSGINSLSLTERGRRLVEVCVSSHEHSWPLKQKEVPSTSLKQWVCVVLKPFTERERKVWDSEFAGDMFYGGWGTNCYLFDFLGFWRSEESRCFCFILSTNHLKQNYSLAR